MNYSWSNVRCFLIILINNNNKNNKRSIYFFQACRNLLLLSKLLLLLLNLSETPFFFFFCIYTFCNSKNRIFVSPEIFWIPYFFSLLFNFPRIINSLIISFPNSRRFVSVLIELDLLNQVTRESMNFE